MNQKIRKFDEAEIEEYKFHQYKSPFLINNIKQQYLVSLLLVNKI